MRALSIIGHFCFVYQGDGLVQGRPNVVVRIDGVILRRARLVPEFVTVFGGTNHLTTRNQPLRPKQAPTLCGSGNKHRPAKVR